MNNTILETIAVENQLREVEAQAVAELNELQLAMIGGGIADVIAG